MSTLILDLGEEVDAFVREQSEAQGCASPEDYVEYLIKQERLRRLLIDGRDSPPGPVADHDYFEERRRRIRERAR